MKKGSSRRPSAAVLSREKSGIICYTTAGIVCAFLFIMLFKSPLRGDDIAWGARIGLERLQNGFAGYNGRYLGNLAVIALTRLPAMLRALVELSVIALLFYCVHLFLKRENTAWIFFLCLFFSMPLEIFTQTITWTSGFSNFFFSALFVTAVLLADLKLAEQASPPKGLSWAPFFLLVFAGQLFLENATIYILALSVCVSALYYFRFRKFSTLLMLQLVAALAGAALMFSNSAYVSAVTQNGGTYKSLNIQSNLFTLAHSALGTFKYVVVKKWFGTNTVVNLAISLLCSAYCLLRKNKLFSTGGIVFSAVFVYGLIFKANPLFNSLNFLCLLSFLFVLYISLVVLLCVKVQEDKTRLLALIFSVLMLMLPLTVAEPLSERCFMNTYLFWALIAAEFFRLIFTEASVRRPNSKLIISIASSLCLLACLISLTAGQTLSWQIQEARLDAIEKFNSLREREREQLILPLVPQSELYCYGINPEYEYWHNNYKEFYEIDLSVELIFVDYEEYCSLQ